ncbi:hypothetical protein AB1Y20_003533 [Prymnesium parvum]|uniref:SAM-dependent MTase RsmB/NOP-type domain-containing protein n=1 Tax=Prymnesium parvum TaxID=97485 RepID=A0AB34J790_PRYPA
MGGHKRKWKKKGQWRSDDGAEGAEGTSSKRHAHDGQYPPAPVLESAAFESYYRAAGVVPEEEWQAFLTSLRTPLGTSFRITGRPDDAATVALRTYMEEVHLSQMGSLEVAGERVPPPYPIEWFAGRTAWRFDVSRSLLRGKGPRKDGVETQQVSAQTEAALRGFHAFLMAEVEQGTIARQEEVSMVPPCLLDVRPGQAVLDMCAAPGSKTQQLIEALGGGDDTSLLLANDAEYKRCHLLVHQAKRLHSPALLVTHHDASLLPTRMGGGAPPLSFDRVLCDVPCSGDGTLRKSPDLWRRWGDGLALGVHRAQCAILSRGLALLAAGGRLVYSTCSINPVEDEAVVAHALRQLRREGQRVRLKCVAEELPLLRRAAGVKAWRVRYQGEWYGTYDEAPEEARRAKKLLPSMFAPAEGEAEALQLERCMRVLPHFQDTGGFFIAVFEKEEGAGGGDGGGGGEEAAGEAGGEAGGEVAGEVEGETALEAGGEEGGEEGQVEEGGEAEGGEAEGGEAEGGEAEGGEAEGGEAEGGEAAGASGGLVGTIRSQANAKPGAHVLGPLHCAAANHGAYDALYALTPQWGAQFAQFLGLAESFDCARVVSRSITGKQLFLVSAPVLSLLQSDRSFRLKLVTSGTRLLERSDLRGLSFPFRLAQEGVHALLPHMRKQLLLASRDDMARLLRSHSVAIASLASASLRAAAAACLPGCCVIALDEPSAGRPLVAVAAMRSLSQPGFLELNVKKPEALSLLRRLGGAASTRPIEPVA